MSDSLHHMAAPVLKVAPQHVYAEFKVKLEVQVPTSGESLALKYAADATTPAQHVSVAEMGPDGAGDARVSDDDLVVLYNGTNHYNALMSAAVVEDLVT